MTSVTSPRSHLGWGWGKGLRPWPSVPGLAPSCSVCKTVKHTQSFLQRLQNSEAHPVSHTRGPVISAHLLSTRHPTSHFPLEK